MKRGIALTTSLVAILFSAFVQAQTPFSVTWSFDGHTGGSSSNANVSGSGAGLVGVVLNNLAQYVPGQSGQAANIGGWSHNTCNYGEYVEVSVQPQNGEKITLTQLSFFVNNSSSAGPQQVKVRSSIDGFSSDLLVQGVSTGFQQAAAGLGGSAYTNQSGAISFRIYGCNGTGGTLRLDNIVISGTVTQTPLPIELLYFRAQSLGTEVQLAWATAWERNTSRFLVQRSRDLQEFSTIASLPAVGESSDRQLYNIIDRWPNAGATYYRLRQIDRDGRFSDSKPVAVVLQDAEPSMTILTNPTNSQRIMVGLRNIYDPVFRLVSLSGQEIVLQAQTRLDQTWELIVSNRLPTGLYVLQVQSGAVGLASRIMLLE